jgi:hypothetical protein
MTSVWDVAPCSVVPQKHKNTQLHVLEGCNVYTRRRENLKSLSVRAASRSTYLGVSGIHA